MKSDAIKLEESDFKNFNFLKKDSKSLNLLIDLAALSSSAVKVIKVMMDGWELEESDKVFQESLEVDSAADMSSLTEGTDISDGNEKLTETEPDAVSDEVIGKGKKTKKKYRKLIIETLQENGRKMKKKKLKKEIIEKSVEFDEHDDADARGEAFEKYLVKVKTVENIDKYVFLLNNEK